MIKPRWVMAYGNRILVEDLEDLPDAKVQTTKRARRQNEAFAMVPLQWAADAAKATRTQGALVWIVLLYTAWKTKNQTFPLPNTLLTKYGVRRDTKTRILRALEAAGRIKVNRKSGRAINVTLIVSPC
jgi:hypothetical protein